MRPSLLYLDLAELLLNTNQLVGSLPTELGLLHLLEDLRVQDNVLLGDSIPSEVSALAPLGYLQRMNLKNTSLVGTVSEELCTIPFMLFDCSDDLCGCECECEEDVDEGGGGFINIGLPGLPFLRHHRGDGNAP